jgi:DNA-binding transcriptional regulator YiaG
VALLPTVGSRKARRSLDLAERLRRVLPKTRRGKQNATRSPRTALGLSQTDFARYLGTSVACVRSWEQGRRRSQSAALRLLTIAKKKPAALLEFVA